MLAPSTKYKVYQLLKAIGENEDIVEEQRQQLATQHGFEPWAAFKRLDRAGLGKLSANDINCFLRENMVDYLSELECFHMFAFFDKDDDGLLDYEDFLQMVLPTTDVQLRAKVAQRDNYEVLPGQKLQSNVEFELSRLLEKEIHFHVKVEQEKTELEVLPDFNSVATFSTLDPLAKGFLDAEAIRTFCTRQSKQQLPKPSLNSIMRRMSDHPDARITFREFCKAITPEMAGLSDEAMTTQFHTEAKATMKQQFDEDSPERGQKSVRGGFLSMQKQPLDSPLKQEFKNLPLKQADDPDTRYVLDMIKMGSPSKDLDAHKQSRRVLASIDQNPVLHNFVEGADPKFDYLWDNTLHARKPSSEVRAQPDYEEDLERARGSLESQHRGYADYSNEQQRQHLRFEAANHSHGNRLSDIGEVTSQQASSHRNEPSQEQNKLSALSLADSSVDAQMQYSSSAGGTRKNNRANRQSFTPVEDSDGAIELLSLMARHEVSLELLRQKLVRECDDFNTVDAFRLIDRQARCEVNATELISSLKSSLGLSADLVNVELLVGDGGTMRYSEFCEYFVPKSQKVLQELQAKVPRNVRGTLSFEECFSRYTRELYGEAWQQIFELVLLENDLKLALLRNPSFDITKSFRYISRGKDIITREDLLKVLTPLDQPHIDILHSRLCQRSPSREVTYANFIENFTPKGSLQY